MFQATTTTKPGVDSEILHLEGAILMFSNSPDVFSVVNLDQNLPVAVHIASPVQATVSVTLPALGSWEGLVGRELSRRAKLLLVSLKTRLSVMLSDWTTCAINKQDMF